MKRAEMTMKMIVEIILLMLGFVVLLIIYGQFGFTGEIDKQVCHESVILRATTPDVAQSLIPLNCKTDKICVGGDTGLFGKKANCDKDFSGAKDVSLTKVKDVTEMEKLISREVVSCWEMMGEGKVSLFSQFFATTYGIGPVYPTCVICSRIAFDKETLDSKGIDLNKVNVSRYMSTYAMPNQEVSYAQYILGEGGEFKIKDDLTLGPIKDVDSKTGGVTYEGKKRTTIRDVATSKDFSKKETPSKELAVLFMQISAPGHVDSLLNFGKTFLGLGAAGVYFGGATTVITGFKAAKFACGGLVRGAICGAIAVIGLGAQYLNVESNMGIAAAKCGDISVGSEARNGCSVVRVVEYNVGDLAGFCSVIEGQNN